MASGSVKLLLKFHKLSELVLLIDYEQDLSHIFECFSKLHNLRKLRVEVSKWRWRLLQNRPNPINDVGKVLGANLNLTHFELFQHAFSGVSFSTIFGHVPASSPLKLEHLGICDIRSSDGDLRAIIPHIRSLTSIDLGASRGSGLITLLHSERIFPPMIQTANITQDVIDYLSDHPGLVGLSIRASTLFYKEKILEIMPRHSGSLTYFGIGILDIYQCWDIKHELSLLQCTKLEQLVLSSCVDGSSNVSEYVVSEQSTNMVRGRTEGMMPVDQRFANYCPSIKLIDVGDRQPDGIRRLRRALPSITESFDPRYGGTYSLPGVQDGMVRLDQ